MAGTRIDTPSTDASVDADTDVEGFIISEDWSVKEYTLGKAFFQFTLLADLVSSSDADETWPEFDVRGTPLGSCKFADPQQSRLSEIKREFPYKAVVSIVQRKIPRDLLRNGTDDHEELMSVLGAILRGKDVNLKSWVTEIIKQRGFYQQDRHTRSREELSMRFPKTDHATTPAASGEHISSLKEYGDKFGEAPKYHEVKIQMQPPLFRSELSFKGQIYVAVGKSKKAARQDVAHKACRAFAVTVGDQSHVIIS
jgi:hypothetical protein